MHTLSYIPVNLKRANCAVYSNDKVFPLSRLQRAYDFIRGETTAGMSYDDKGNIRFSDDSSIRWEIEEVYLAMKMYNAAEDGGISFYEVRNEDKIPQLFVSSKFNHSRIVVSAANMKAVIVNNSIYRSKVTSLIDRQVSMYYCFNLFQTLCNMETGSANYLRGLLVKRDTSEEVMITSPMLTPLSEECNRWKPDEMESLREVVNGSTKENEAFVLKEGRYYCKSRPDIQPLVKDLATYLLSTYDSLRAKKSDYYELVDNFGKPQLYFSTNHMYLVNANTFQTLVVKNQNCKALLQLYAANEYTDYNLLYVAWQMALTE